jgi:hypothetical protein
MKLSPKWLPPFVLLLGMRSLAAADELPAYLPPDTGMLVGIQVHSLVDAFAQAAGPELKGKLSAVLAKTPLAGFDPLKDLDEVLITSTGGGDNPATLAVLRGRFGAVQVGEKAARYREVPMIAAGTDGKSVFALLDETTALAGDLALVRAAIDRHANGEETRLPFVAKLEPMRQRYAIWGSGTVPKSGAANADAMGSIERFEFGANFADGLEMVADLYPRSPADLEKLSASLRMVEAMMKAKAGAGGGQLSMTSEGGRLRLSVNIPKEELVKAFEAQKGILTQAVMSKLPPGLAARLNAAPEDRYPTSRPVPASETKIVSNSEGETLTVTLPGARK